MKIPQDYKQKTKMITCQNNPKIKHWNPQKQLIQKNEQSNQKKKKLPSRQK